MDPTSRQSKAYVDDTSFMVNLSEQNPQDQATKPVFHPPIKYLEWVTDGWLEECWQILQMYKFKLHSRALWAPALLRQNDTST